MARLRELLAAWGALGRPRGPDQAAELSVVLEPDADVGAASRLLEAQLAPVRAEVFPAFTSCLAGSGGDRFLVIRMPDLTAEGAELLAFEAARELAGLDLIQSAHPVLIDSLVGIAALPGLRAQAGFSGLCETKDAGPAPRGWAPRYLGVIDAWSRGQGQGVTIASIDTGRSDHEDVAEIWSEDRPHLNLIEGGHDARDRFSQDVLSPNPGHGTLVGSVAASRGGLTPGGDTTGPGQVTGAAPAARVLPIRAIRSVIDLRQSRLPAAFEHVLDTGCEVVLMCLGAPYPIAPVTHGLEALAKAGVITICAAGNCYGPVVYPARLAKRDLVTAIAGVDARLRPWERSCRGPQVVASAFGEAVWGAAKRAADAPDDTVLPGEGTSLAAALAAGVAALWLGHHGAAETRAFARTAGVTVQALFNHAVRATARRPTGWPAGFGAGLIDAEALLRIPLADLHVGAGHSARQAEATGLAEAVTDLAAELDPAAGLEAAGLAEPLAAEALWGLYLGAARRRATDHPDWARLKLAASPAPSHTPAFAAELEARPRLAALM